MFRAMFGHAARRGRGDVRAAILLVLAEQPYNGYQIMQEIERRSDGAWRPSSGSIYPSLQQLEDEGLVGVESTPAGKQYKLTDRGTKYVTANRAKLGTPWESQSGDPRVDVMSLLGQLAPALQQVARYGTAEQLTEASRIVTDARRTLYRLLAEEPDADE
jgi:DNA-binding PadR family transcriptional regulator